MSDSRLGRANDAPRLTDHALEQIIGRLLQIGVLISALVVVLGGVALLIRYGGAPADFRSFRAEPSELSTLVGIVRGASRLDSHAVVQLGLVLLIATPIMRVALTLVAFWWQRDRLYVGITAFVLALLVYGLFWGRA
ncbi:MAG TPA: DUF1634 domain-containing protein [Gemmatimonadaceae bacterium]|nr:DUF1634 domain-containing protein [Gemmatimonadaceae bacterium]